MNVEEILKYYDLWTTLEDTKMYNPWSIINHCDTGKLESYWVNTSANVLIMKLLKNAETAKIIF